MRLVFKVLAGILRPIHVDPLAESMSLPVLEHALIEVPVGPSDLPLAIGYTSNELSLVL